MFKFLVKNPMLGLLLNIITFIALLSLCIFVWIKFGFWYGLVNWTVVGGAFQLLTKRVLMPKLHQANEELRHEESLESQQTLSK